MTKCSKKILQLNRKNFKRITAMDIQFIYILWEKDDFLVFQPYKTNFIKRIRNITKTC